MAAFVGPQRADPRDWRASRAAGEPGRAASLEIALRGRGALGRATMHEPTSPLAALDALVGGGPIFDVVSAAPARPGALPLTEDLLLNAPSGDLFG